MLPSITPDKELCSCPVDGCQESGWLSTVSSSPELTKVGVPRYQLDRLQSVLNTAARLIVGTKKQDHIKHVLWVCLYWLPVLQRIQFKLCLLTYKVLHRLALSYIAALHRPVTSFSSRQRLRSATSGDLVVFSSVTHLAPMHLLWRVLRPGTNCRCTQEHGKQLDQGNTFALRWLSPNCPGMPHQMTVSCYRVLEIVIVIINCCRDSKQLDAQCSTTYMPLPQSAMMGTLPNTRALPFTAQWMSTATLKRTRSGTYGTQSQWRLASTPVMCSEWWRPKS